MELQRRSEGPPILTNTQQCLRLYPFEDWRRLEDELVGMSSIDVNDEALRRFLLSGASECPIDAQGRLLIPPYLREHADLKKEVAIAGIGVYIEIWDKARFDAEITRTTARYPEIASAAKVGT